MSCFCAVGDGEWTTLVEEIDHEFFLASNLSPNSPYQFRLKAKNFIGWGEFSASTATIRTAAEGEIENGKNWFEEGNGKDVNKGGKGKEGW